MKPVASGDAAGSVGLAGTRMTCFVLTLDSDIEYPLVFKDHKRQNQTDKTKRYWWNSGLAEAVGN